MKKYEKPQIDICHIEVSESMLDLSLNNEEGNGIQRSKERGSDFEESSENIW